MPSPHQYDHAHDERSPLAISELAEFDRDIVDDPPEVQRRKRLVYLAQVSADMDQALIAFDDISKSISKKSGCSPLRLLGAGRLMKSLQDTVVKTQVQQMDRNIDMALDYWGLTREELDQFRRS